MKKKKEWIKIENSKDIVRVQLLTWLHSNKDLSRIHQYSIRTFYQWILPCKYIEIHWPDQHRSRYSCILHWYNHQCFPRNFFRENRRYRCSGTCRFHPHTWLHSGKGLMHTHQYSPHSHCPGTLYRTRIRSSRVICYYIYLALLLLLVLRRDRDHSYVRDLCSAL